MNDRVYDTGVSGSNGHIIDAILYSSQVPIPVHDQLHGVVSYRHRPIIYQLGHMLNVSLGKVDVTTYDVVPRCK